MMVFTDEDIVVNGPNIELLDQNESSEPSVESWSESESDVRHTRLFHYTAPAGTIRSRLELQGFSTTWVHKLSHAFIQEGYENEDPFEFWPEGATSYPDAASVVRALTSRRGLSAVCKGEFPRVSSETQFLHDWWEALREAFDDPRFALALSLARTRATTRVTVDLSDLLLGGWLEPTELPHQAARARLSTAIAADGPVIVVVEGSSDARWLKRALELTAPQVSHCFEFLDFHQHNPPGGADRVVSLTKGMAAAGVMNRVVAVLDNDTAGREAAQQLVGSKLPDRFSVATLPDVAYARRYPTLGPDGLGVSDVNGRAVSIEFMFGDQMLRAEDGSQFPVRWQSFIEKARNYQGRLTGSDKKIVGKRIDSTFKQKDGRRIPNEVLQGCRRLSEMLINAAHLPERLPVSEASVLTATWIGDPFVELQISG